MLKKASSIIAIITLFAIHSSAQCTTGNCYEGNGSYLFENGDLFNGSWKKGLPNGYGVYEFTNGDVYKGAWDDGLMDGRGTYTYNNGDKYIGGWKEGKMNGRGHFHWELAGDLMNNAKYEGFFKDGVPSNIDMKETATPAEPPKHK